MRYFVCIFMLMWPGLAMLLAKNNIPHSPSSHVAVGDTTVESGMKDTLKLFDLESITIVGDRAKSLPGSGQYIQSRTLEILNQSNINNILRTIPGVNIRDEEGFGLRPNIGLRGTQVNRCAKITLMEDGILIAPAPYADPSAYYFPTFARMKAVEVLKGSSQIKYGPYTIGGAINLISTPIPDSFKGSVKLSYGSFGTNQQRLWVGDSKENIDYVIEVSRLASNGFKELDNRGKTGFDRKDFMGKLRWQSGQQALIQQSLTLKFVHADETGHESYLGLTYNDFKVNPYRRYAATQKDILTLNHQHITLNHTIMPMAGISVSSSAYLSNTFRDWARVNTIGGQSLNNILGDPDLFRTPYQIMAGQVNGNIDYQSAARNYTSKGVQSTAQYLSKLGSVTHKIQLGVRYHEDKADRMATKSVYSMSNGTMLLTTAGEDGNQENQIRKATGFAGFISCDFQYKMLKVSPGLRYEKIKFDFENYGNFDSERLGTALKSATNALDIILPGIGINVEFNKFMSTFAGIHKGFSPPGMPSINTTHQAKSETAINYEVGYRFNRRNVHVQVVGFLNNYANILGSDNVSAGGAGSGDLFNAGHANIQGVELSIEYDMIGNKNHANSYSIPIHAAYTYTDARFKETFINVGGDWGSGQIYAHDIIPFITPHMLTTSVGFENNVFKTALSGRYVGTTRIKPGQNSLIIPSENVKYSSVNAIAGFLILDFSINVNISRQFTIFSTLNNITNNKAIVTHLPNGYRPNMPMNFNVGVKAEF
jgi:Fe(3+) dicitrate transport protein